MKKMFRVGMACLLVLALLLYLSPVRVSASAIPEAAAVVTKVIPFAKVVEPAALGLGGSIFCWAAAAIGVIFTGYQAVQAYNDFQDFTGLLETSIYYYPDGSWSYGVDMGFVERVWAFLFDAGYVISTGDKYQPKAETSLTLADGKVFSIKNTEFTYSVCSYYDTYYGEIRVGELCWWPAYQNGVHRSGYYLDGNSRNGTITSVDSVEYRYHFHVDTNAKLRAPYYGSFSEGSGSRSPEKMFVTAFIAGFVSGSVVSMIEDVKIGTVAPLEIPMPEAYPEWYANSRPATNPYTDEEITVLPIPLNPSADPETQIGTLTQPEIWQGTIADPMPGTGALPDGSIAETPWNDVQDWLTPSGEPGRFGIQLRDYFPFCIPFDLYDFLMVLAAEPEAPCFDWEVPVPQMGRTFKVEVDLAAWDSVAALFRKLELLAFIVGLGWVTREKIRG